MKDLFLLKRRREKKHSCLKGNQSSPLHSSIYPSEGCMKRLFCFKEAIKLGADGRADLTWYTSLL